MRVKRGRTESGLLPFDVINRVVCDRVGAGGGDLKQKSRWRNGVFVQMLWNGGVAATAAHAKKCQQNITSLKCSA